MQGHDVTMDLPLGDAKVTVSSRNLASDELSLNVKFAGDGVVEGKGKKGNFFKKGVCLYLHAFLSTLTPEQKSEKS